MARDICRGKQCTISSTNFMSRTFFYINKHFGIDLNKFVALNEVENYVHMLSDSNFTLCPSGNNPEQFRIWEALELGSIPIIEDHYIPPGAIHPKYSDTWMCTDDERHYWLKKTNAPVIFLDNWKELPGILASMTPADVAERQRNLAAWYKNFKLLMRKLFNRQMIEFLGSTGQQ